MVYTFVYHADVKKHDLKEIDERNKAIIRKAIEERLAVQPEKFAKPLQRSLKGYWRLRVGEYRIVFKIKDDTVLILGIIHRKKIYQQIFKRVHDRKAPS
jgi:mRNA interferase RelE/StbE